MSYTMFAAIQVGSNEISMKIYEISKKYGIKEINYLRSSVEIGAETYRNNNLSHNVINNICDILLDFKQIMKDYGVLDYVAIASSAIREAQNSIVVLDRIKITTGIKVKVISNSEKRFLYYKAVTLKNEEFNNMINKSTAMVDVGAGSIQISLYNKGALVVTQNIRLGFLRIIEMLTEFSAQSKNYASLIEEYINNDLNTFRKLILNNDSIQNIIAVGDNMNEFSKVCLEDVKDNILSYEDFKKIYEKLLTQPLDVIASQYNISMEQAVLMLPTAMIYMKMFEIANSDNMWIPGVHLNDGIALDYAIKNQNLAAKHDFSGDIIAAARVIASKYKCDSLHTDNVEYIALKIFDSIKKIHGMGKRERLLMQLAVILHNCGAYINMNEVLINSYNIIMSTEIMGLANSERNMIANIVKSITYDIPLLNDLKGTINKDDYIIIGKITAILRLADALDKSHLQKFNKINIDVTNGIMTITAYTLADITLEKGLFDKSSGFFTEVYGIKPKIKRKK